MSSEQVIEKVTRAFERALDKNSGSSRVLAKQLISVGKSCNNVEEFIIEATKFASGFKHENRRVLDGLYQDIQQDQRANDDATTMTYQSQDQQEQEEYDFDRAFYGVEDAGSGVFLGSEKRWRQREQMMASSSGSTSKSLGARIRKQNRDTDQSAWEDNLMYRSGVKSGRVFDTNFDDELDERINIVVHNIKPPFLQRGDLLYSLENAPESAQVVRDEKSDMAVAAMKGSSAVARIREQTVRTKMKHKFWELGGSRMGKAMGISGEANYGQNDNDKVEKDLRKLAKEESKGQVGLSPREEIERVRRNLPINRVRSSLLQVIRNNQVVIVVGQTGSGKTTQLTQYLREDGYSHKDKRLIVGCTQPRRVAAMSVAKRVADEVGCKIGDEVGYSMRFEDVTSDKTEIKYMTDGVLMRETLSSSDLDRYSCIVMDEAHERSLFTDVLFGILLGVVKRRLDFKLIVTSATMDADKFSKFFGGAATFHIPGRTFKVDTYFSKSTCLDYVEATVKQAVEIHLSHPPGDILIFMTGQEDITATCQLLADKLSNLGEGVPELLLLPMYSQLPADMQSKIFDAAKPGQRKCIVSTNIAETSLTVDGIRYVIDSGFCKLKVFNPRIGMDSLRITPVSQANANQRAGRAGRTAQGYCWRMFTENQYVRELLPAQVPEIQRTNLGNVVLLLKSLGVRDLLKFDFMDPPPRDNIVNSMYQLWVLGALNDNGDLTKLGTSMGKYPLDPPLSKMLITAQDLNCASDVLTVVSMLSVPEVFYRPNERAEESDQARERFFVPESDHLTLLNVYNLAEKQRFNSAWCSKHFIHVKALIKARDVRTQLQGMVKSADDMSSTPVSRTASWDLVRKAICSAYFIHAAKLKNITQYINLLSGTPTNLHPSSAICGSGETPDYVVYHELVLTSKEYMRTVTAIDPCWLAELGPMFFSVKGRGRNRTQVSSSSSSQSQPTGPLSAPIVSMAKSKKKQKVAGIGGGDSFMKKKKRKRFGL